MKYFTNDWHRSGSQYTNEFKEKVKEYNEFVKSNYEFYPEWYKIPSLAFHDALVEKFYCDGNDLIILLKGFEFANNNSHHKMIFKDAEILERPIEIEGKYILDDELYCNKDFAELHLLLQDNDTTYSRNLTIKCKEILLQKKKFLFYH